MESPDSQRSEQPRSSEIPEQQEEKHEQKKKDKKKSLIDFSWSLKILVLTFAISFSLSYLSESALSDVNITIAAVVLCVFILIGVAFDLVGTAVTAVEVKSFHSMAAKKVHGAKASLYLVARAPAVSNICNDVIGDICGVISGSMGAVLATEIASALGINVFFSTLAVTALTASLTVFLKSIGKNIAIAFCDKIIFAVARSLCFIIPERVFDEKKKK